MLAGQVFPSRPDLPGGGFFDANATLLTAQDEIVAPSRGGRNLVSISYDANETISEIRQYLYRFFSPWRNSQKASEIELPSAF